MIKYRLLGELRTLTFWKQKHPSHIEYENNIDLAVVDLSHLEPFNFRCQVENGSKVKVNIRFSPHTFTSSFNIHMHIENQICFDNRVFCWRRHSLSKTLPSIMKSLFNHKIMKTSEGDSYTFDTKIFSPTGPYFLFFTVKKYNKSKKDKGVNIYVRSAYPFETKQFNTNGLQKIRFTKLIENIYNGRST